MDFFLDDTGKSSLFQGRWQLEQILVDRESRPFAVLNRDAKKTICDIHCQSKLYIYIDFRISILELKKNIAFASPRSTPSETPYPYGPPLRPFLAAVTDNAVVNKLMAEHRQAKAMATSLAAGRYQLLLVVLRTNVVKWKIPYYWYCHIWLIYGYYMVNNRQQ